MSIQIITGFSLNNATPIDTRIVASGSSQRDAIPYKYEGLRIFDLSNNRPYVYTSGTWSKEITDQVFGTTGSISKFVSSNTVGDSNIYQVGANVGINTSNPLASSQFGPYPVPASGYSMPFTIHKSGGLAGTVYVSSTVLGHNWYYSGGESYFDSSVGSSKLIFGSYGDMYFQNKAGGPGSFAQSIYVSPSGRVGIGSGFAYATQPNSSLQVTGTVSSTYFSGNGASITNISPSNISNQTLINAGTSVTASNVSINTSTTTTSYIALVKNTTSSAVYLNSNYSYNTQYGHLKVPAISLGQSTGATVSSGESVISRFTNGQWNGGGQSISLTLGSIKVDNNCGVYVKATFNGKTNINSTSFAYRCNVIEAYYRVSGTGVFTQVGITLDGFAVYYQTGQSPQTFAGFLDTNTNNTISFKQGASSGSPYSLNSGVDFQISVQG